MFTPSSFTDEHFTMVIPTSDPNERIVFPLSLVWKISALFVVLHFGANSLDSRQYGLVPDFGAGALHSSPGFLGVYSLTHTHSFRQISEVVSFRKMSKALQIVAFGSDLSDPCKAAAAAG